MINIMIAIVVDSSILAGSSVIIAHICTAKDVDLSVNETSSLIAVPMAKTNAALSPMIRPIAKMVAVKMPENALGKITLKVV